MELAYYGDYAQAEQLHWWFTARRKILGSLIESVLEPSERRIILEVGTGTGAMGQMLSRYGRYIGLDASWTALEHARTKLKHLVTGRLEALPFPAQSFDAVFACDVIEHLEDDRIALSELRRVCTAQGKLFVTVPAFQGLWSNHDVVNHHYRRYTKARLAAALEESQWQIEKLSYFNALLFLPIAGLRLAMKRRVHSRGEPPRSDFAWRVPLAVNALLEKIFASERYLLRWGDLPFGVSLVAIATPHGREGSLKRTIARPWAIANRWTRHSPGTAHG